MDLNGYAIVLDSGTALVDPPAPEGGGWPSLLKPITAVVLTNRDHVRDVQLFRTRYGPRLIARRDELPQLAPLAIDEAVGEGDLNFERSPRDPSPWEIGWRDRAVS